MTGAGATRRVLTGLRGTPLASYLAGLGLVRVLGEQADPAVRVAWTPAGLSVVTWTGKGRGKS